VLGIVGRRMQRQFELEGVEVIRAQGVLQHADRSCLLWRRSTAGAAGRWVLHGQPLSAGSHVHGVCSKLGRLRSDTI
jgi:hypothetical protein